nr:response regulator transcription factor [Polymorphobacter sp.]
MHSGDMGGARDSFRAKLLLGDPQPLVAAGLASLLGAAGHHVAACVYTGAAAETAILSGGIDVAVIDIDFADPSPSALVALLRQRRQRVPIIVMAPDADHPALSHVIESGIDGLVLKSQAATGLDHCLTTVIAGSQWFDRRAMAHALDRAHIIGGAGRLTPRERDVAKLVATGQRNRSIADRLGISEGTVKMHLHNVYAKMGLESRTQLAMDGRLKMLA